MKAITTYEANDGSQHDSREKAIGRDLLIANIRALMMPLGERPDDTDFSNGNGFIQHTEAIIQRVKGDLLYLAKPYLGDLIKQEWIDRPQEVHPMSFVGRLFDEVDGPLRKAWFRLMCVDGDWREWGQPYYAINPTEGKQFNVREKVAA